MIASDLDFLGDYIDSRAQLEHRKGNSRGGLLLGYVSLEVAEAVQALESGAGLAEILAGFAEDAGMLERNSARLELGAGLCFALYVRGAIAEAEAA